MVSARNKNIIIHMLCWVLYLVVLITLLSARVTIEEAIARNVLFVGIQASMFYLNSFVLLPKLLENKQYLIYGIAIAGAIFGSVFLLHLIDDFVFDESMVAKSMKREMRRHSGFNVREHKRYFMRGRTVMHGISMFGILFVSTLIRNVSVSRRRELEASSLQLKATEAESKFLKSQINPHFLFNALNNIYALSQMKSDKAPDGIHKLSQMLRYVLYESNEPLVSLSKEEEYLNGFVEMQKLKDDDNENIQVDIRVDGTKKIAPLLLIPFVENAFKHSYVENGGWVRLNVTTVGNELLFDSINSVPSDQKKDEVGGVGLENVRRRLELIYPGKHELQVDATETEYHVQLKVILD